jgi:hypothetical protein
MALIIFVTQIFRLSEVVDKKEPRRRRSAFLEAHELATTLSGVERREKREC